MLLPWVLSIAGLLQDPAPPASPPPDAHRPGLSVRVEPRAASFDFHFDNPSNFEPGPLVPHFFEQHYDADNVWFFVRADYRVAGIDSSTEAGFTPRVTRFGSDIDTFFQPSGDIITSGTRGHVRLRSLSIEQRLALSRWRRATFGVVIGYRRSAMDYLPSDRIVTHTRPPSETREPVPGHENTWSHVVESGVMAVAPVALGTRWTLTLGADVLPITRARLAISLPDKFPGEIIRGDTFSFGARGRVAVERRGARLSVGGAATFGGAWGYRSRAHYDERAAGAGVFLRLTPR